MVRKQWYETTTVNEVYETNGEQVVAGNNASTVSEGKGSLYKRNGAAGEAAVARQGIRNNTNKFQKNVDVPHVYTSTGGLPNMNQL